MEGHVTQLRRPAVIARPQPPTCAWCAARFVTIIELIDHVETSHVPAAA